MGSRISQSNGQEESQRANSFSAGNLYRSFRESIERRRQRARHRSEGHHRNHGKRSSMNRPVLRLQVKPETLKRHKNMTGHGLHLISKEKLETLARESGMYENIFPTSPPPVPFTRNHKTHNHFRHSTTSRESMVIVQFVDNGPVNLAEGGKHENGYDRIAPRGDFDHLCTLRYGKVNSNVGSSGQFDKSEDQLSTTNITRHNSQPSLAAESLMIEQLKDRIIEHLEPYEPDPVFQRSNSLSALSSMRVNNADVSNMRRHHQSTGYLDSNSNLGDWSLGESIMRTLSKGNILLFDIDNPQHESEKEVNRAWPNLKDKLARWRQSQNSLNILDHHTNTTPPSQS